MKEPLFFSSNDAPCVGDPGHHECPAFCYRKRTHRHEFWVVQGEDTVPIHAKNRDVAHSFVSAFKLIGMRAKVLHKVIYKLEEGQPRTPEDAPVESLDYVDWDSRRKITYYDKPEL